MNSENTKRWANTLNHIQIIISDTFSVLKSEFQAVAAQQEKEIAELRSAIEELEAKEKTAKQQEKKE